MKVILKSEVDNLGLAGDVVDVADGYGRNFLIPRGLAILATKGAMKEAEALTRSRKAAEAKTLGSAEAMREALESRTLRISARVDERGALYGSVSAGDIHRVLKERGHDVAAQADRAQGHDQGDRHLRGSGPGPPAGDRDRPVEVVDVEGKVGRSTVPVPPSGRRGRRARRAGPRGRRGVRGRAAAAEEAEAVDEPLPRPTPRPRSRRTSVRGHGRRRRPRRADPASRGARRHQRRPAVSDGLPPAPDAPPDGSAPAGVRPRATALARGRGVRARRGAAVDERGLDVVQILRPEHFYRGAHRWCSRRSRRCTPRARRSTRSPSPTGSPS
jgi:large subunit ribosomal protein L9